MTGSPPAASSDSPTIAIRIYSVLFWIGFLWFTFLAFIAVLLLLPTTLLDPRRRIVHIPSSVWGWSIFALHPFWSIEVEGREKLPWDGRALFVVNHESLADILAVGALFRPYKFVSKASIFSIPVLGWGMSLVQHIPLSRGDRESIEVMLQACRDWLNREMAVLMFPEGTRSDDGVLKPFKRGAFQLAVETSSPVYPIVLAGTGHTLPKHGFLLPLRAHVRMKVLDSVDPDTFDGDIDELRDHVRDLMVAEKTLLAS